VSERQQEGAKNAKIRVPADVDGHKENGGFSTGGFLPHRLGRAYSAWEARQNFLFSHVLVNVNLNVPETKNPTCAGTFTFTSTW
jgi:hypothetical protein